MIPVKLPKMICPDTVCPVVEDFKPVPLDPACPPCVVETVTPPYMPTVRRERYVQDCYRSMLANMTNQHFCESPPMAC